MFRRRGKVTFKILRNYVLIIENCNFSNKDFTEKYCFICILKNTLEIKKSDKLPQMSLFCRQHCLCFGIRRINPSNGGGVGTICHGRSFEPLSARINAKKTGAKTRFQLVYAGCGGLALCGKLNWEWERVSDQGESRGKWVQWEMLRRVNAIFFLIKKTYFKNEATN